MQILKKKQFNKRKCSAMKGKKLGTSTFLTFFLTTCFKKRVYGYERGLKLYYSLFTANFIQW